MLLLDELRFVAAQEIDPRATTAKARVSNFFMAIPPFSLKG